jgi:2-amino-4-hydroxy-6-hydroxymethyldihydropteridine diphosphokinase
MSRAFVGLGSNLGDRQHLIAEAVDALRETPGLNVLEVSTVRETEPVDFLDQPPFLNAVVALETDFEALELLDHLLEIERNLGRTREDGPRFGPRTIDLDLLLYGNERISAPGLEVPHPRLHERRFALEPLAELDPELVVPGWGKVAVLLRGLD